MVTLARMVPLGMRGDAVPNTPGSTVDPGVFGTASPRIPSGTILAKVTIWPALNQRIDLSHNHAEGTSTRGLGAVEFASHGGTEPATFDGSRASCFVGAAPT